MRSRRGTYSVAVPLTLLLIPRTPSAAFNTTATSAGIENVGVYLAIAVSARVNIVCE